MRTPPMAKSEASVCTDHVWVWSGNQHTGSFLTALPHYRSPLILQKELLASGCLPTPPTLDDKTLPQGLSSSKTVALIVMQLRNKVVD